MGINPSEQITLRRHFGTRLVVWPETKIHQRQRSIFGGWSVCLVTTQQGGGNPVGHEDGARTGTNQHAMCTGELTQGLEEWGLLQPARKGKCVAAGKVDGIALQKCRYGIAAVVLLVDITSRSAPRSA